MRKFITLAIVAGIFMSCEKENDKTFDSSFFYSPQIKVEKGDNEATLSLTDPRPFTEYYPYPPSSPDYFEIYYSNDKNDLTFYKKVDVSTTSVTVSNLNNGDSYYFMVVSKKGNYNPLYTDTIMTIPSLIEDPEEIFPGKSYSTERVLYSHDKSYMAFKSNDFSTHYHGMDMLYYTDIADDSTWVLEIDTYGANWSNSNNVIVYISTTTSNNTLYPNILKLFDAELKESTTLFDIDFDNYYVSTPVFSPDDKLLGYLSSENNSERYKYDFWTLDLSTQEKTKISNFESMNFSVNGFLDWSKNENSIYLDGYFETNTYKYNIYKLDVSSGELFPVIESPWHDRKPSLSPDNSKIAFVSDRSGTDELWVFNFGTSQLKQVSGGWTTYRFDSRSSNIQWIDNNELVFSVFEGSISKAVKVEI
jgi:hypothetical protein